MSAEDGGSGGTGSGDGGPVGGGGREIAHRLFAAEFDDATLSYSESDEERAPNYVVTPTGARVNRLFAVGVLTEVEAVNEETSRGRIVDPTGAFVTYAGQYQPDEAAFLERADPPAFVALTGKARTFEPEDSDRVFTSVRPESLNAVDARTRDRWVVSTAEATLDRLAVFVRALESDLRGDRLREALAAGGASTAVAAGIPKALATYDTSPAYVEAIRRTAVEALELVAGEREEVTRPSMAPAERGEVGISEIGPLPETNVTIAYVDAETDAEPAAVNESAADAEPIDDDSAAPAASEDVAEVATEEPPTAEPEPEPEPEVDPEQEPEPEPEVDPEQEPETEPEVDPEQEPEPEPGEETEPDETQAATDASAGGSESVEGTDIDASPDDDPEGGDGMYELDEDERREVEDEYGTEFTTGTEVDDPGEADIDVPDADELAAELEADAGDEATDVDPAEEKTEPDTDEESEATDDVDPADVDLESAAVDAIGAIDDGDGADREAVVARVVDEYGVDPDAVEDAIQDALMGGLCYEPGDDRLKAI
ncbi:hypothetical protein RH858_00890 [Halalkaliarchaeum sp. AArc-GB]|uniref:RPA family protein n=1 Tax=Halalkaliarchaeum sp. AArc-GB TaxID=3074078 RepID=UPI002854DAC1|nr:hypothetical protein [Halalkaliarchaeum sp. AArc-GB]MDR5671709.1 hypothetical protein [Halalkaliarchaeum sp. AArc-GB]